MTEATNNDTVLEIRDLTKSFRVGFWGAKVEAVSNLTLEVRKNEIFGFLGPNGAGKTTSIKTILGLIYPTSGSINIFGKPHTDVKTRNYIGFLPENPYFYDYLTAGEFLRFYGQLAGIGRSDRKDKALELLKLVGLEGCEKLQLHKFSKGMLQRIGLAQALINDPDLVILDEPMSGLDPVGRKEVRDLILKLKDQGKTVFFSTHILPDVEVICDRVGIIHKGRLRAVGKLSDILRPNIEAVEVVVSGIADYDFLESMSSRLVRQGELTQMVLEKLDKVDGVISNVIEHGGHIVEVFPRRQSLETYFLETIGGNEDSGEAAK